MAVHACHLSTREAEAGITESWREPGLLTQTISKIEQSEEGREEKGET